MLKGFFKTIFIIFILCNFSFAKEPKWLIKTRQIVPLQSTEAEVRKLFGKVTRRFENIERFESKDGVLAVTYSTGECRSNLATYNVQKGIVVEANFFPAVPVSFSVVEENTSDFEREESSDAQNATYKNLTKGIEYSVVRNDAVERDRSPRLLTSVSIFPPQKYSNLECSNVSS